MALYPPKKGHKLVIQAPEVPRYIREGAQALREVAATLEHPRRSIKAGRSSGSKRNSKD